MSWAGRHCPVRNPRKGKDNPYADCNSPEEIRKRNAVVSQAFGVDYQDFTTPSGRIELLALMWESTHFRLFTEYRYDFEKDDYVQWINIKLILGYAGNKGSMDYRECPAALLALAYQVITHPPEWREKVPWNEKHYESRDVLINEGRKKRPVCVVCNGSPCRCHLLFSV